MDGEEEGMSDKPKKPRVYRKAFITVYEAEGRRGGSLYLKGTTVAEARRLLKEKPTRGAPVVIAVDAIRAISESRRSTSAHVQEERTGGVRIDTYIEGPDWCSTAIDVVGRYTRFVVESVPEVKALIDKALADAAL